MKAVLMSIQPKWCELIASGKINDDVRKTVEVRKTRPNIKTPFKVYIYCTKGRSEALWRYMGEYYYDTQFPNERPNKANGKVIGEFVCDEIYSDNQFNDKTRELLDNACLTLFDIAKYLKPMQVAHFWHISNLIIYDKPKKLSEFYIPCYSGCDNCEYQSWDYSYAGGKDLICTVRNKKPIKRPPQSWCYVEELG